MIVCILITPAGGAPGQVPPVHRPTHDVPAVGAPRIIFRRSFVYPHRCALAGVSFSTLSTGRFVLTKHICKGAESAEHAETAGYTYEGTQTTA